MQNKSGSITLFAFDKGQELSKYSAPFDALVQIVDGNARILIGETAHDAEKGEVIILPANVPHAVEATGRLKMLLTMIRG